jgi:hypothetical protein
MGVNQKGIDMNTTGKKFGGRKKGQPNLITQSIRESFQKLIEDSLPQLEKDLQEIEPSQRLKIIIDLAAYVIPKLKTIESRIETVEPIYIDFSE